MNLKLIGIIGLSVLSLGGVGFFAYKRMNKKNVVNESDDDEGFVSTGYQEPEPMDNYAFAENPTKVYIRAYETSPIVWDNASGHIGTVTEVLDYGYDSEGKKVARKWLKVNFRESHSYKEKGISKTTKFGYVPKDCVVIKQKTY